MQKKRLFSNPNRKKLIIDNQVYTKNFTGPQASHIIYFCERAYAVAYGAYWIAPIATGNTARNGASPLFWRVYALHTPRVSYGMTEDIKRFDMEIQLLKDIDDAIAVFIDKRIQSIFRDDDLFKGIINRVKTSFFSF